MCGIAGWNMTEKPAIEFILTLAQEMINRGEDSYGFFSPETGIRKSTGAITQGIRAKDMLTPAGFLHTRHATTGKIKTKNAHPFAIGNIIFAHNGVVYNHSELNKQFSRQCSVDSMHIAHHLIENKSLTDLEGYGAIQFYQDSAWYIGACNYGDLECAKLKDGKGIVWASTQESIECAVFQAGYEIEHFYRIEQGKIYKVESDSLYNTDRTFQLTKHVFPLASYPLPASTDKVYSYGGQNYKDRFSTSEDHWRKVWQGDYADDTKDNRKGLDGAIATQTDDSGTELAAGEYEPKSEYGACEWCNEFKLLDTETSELYSADLCFECAKKLA
jgi:Glutamine amidotransferase domain